MNIYRIIVICLSYFSLLRCHFSSHSILSFFVIRQINRLLFNGFSLFRFASIVKSFNPLLFIISHTFRYFIEFQNDENTFLVYHFHFEKVFNEKRRKSSSRKKRMEKFHSKWLIVEALNWYRHSSNEFCGDRLVSWEKGEWYFRIDFFYFSFSTFYFVVFATLS